jgi:uncharacterized protein (TIGR03437 family)
MHFLKSRCFKIYFCCVAVMALCAAPALAQLTANPSEVRFTYQTLELPPNPINVVIRNAGVIVPVTNAVIAAQPSGVVGPLFGTAILENGSVNVGIPNPNLLAPLVAVPAREYTGGVLRVTAAGGLVLDVPLSIAINLGTGGSGLIASPTDIQLDTPNNLTTRTQLLTVTSTTGASTFTAEATTQSGVAWLTLDLSSTTTVQKPFSGGLGTVQVLANPAGLGIPSTDTGTIRIRDSLNNETNVQVTLRVGVTQTGLSVAPSSIIFTAPQLNTSPAGQPLQISSSLAGVTFTATPSTFTGGAWLSLSSTSGVLPSTPTVFANTTGLAAGQYSGQIVIQTAGAVTATQTIPVTLTVGTDVGVGGAVTPTSLTFSGQAGGANRPGDQRVAISGIGSFTAAVISSGTTWLSVSPLAGDVPGTVTVSVNPVGLTATTYNGTVRITVGGVAHDIPVSLVLTSAVSVVASPGSVLWLHTQEGVSGSGFLQLLASDNSTGIPITITPSAPWITVTSPSSTLPASIGLTLNTAGLAAGANLGELIVTATGAANSPLTIPVIVHNLTGTGGTGLTITPTSLSFSALPGGTSPPDQILSLGAGVFTPFTASVATSSGGNWLSVIPNQGNAPRILTVSANSAGLTAGTYNGTITITTSSGAQNINVTLTVGAGATLTFSPASLSFDLAQGGTETKAVQVSSIGASIGATVAASTSSGGNWLTVTASQQTTPFQISATVSTAGVPAGTHQGTITVTPSGGSAQTIPVTLVVQAAPTVTASPTSLSFTYRSGDANPAAQQINVSATGSATPLNFTAAAAGGNWLSVSPTSGTTPGAVNVSVTPGNLDVGTYNGTVTVQGTGGATGSTTVNVTLTVTAPLPTVTRVVNAATFLDGPIAPGEIITIGGTDLGPNEIILAQVSGGRLTTSLGGVQVLIGGFAAPMISIASRNQVSAIVPYQVAGLLDTFVQVRYRGVSSNAFRVGVVSTSPGIFAQNSSGSGPGVILNQDGTLNGPGNPAEKGSIVVIFGTGEGVPSNRPESGAIITATTLEGLPRPLLRPAARVDGQPADVVYAGSISGQVAGFLQFNVRLSPTARSGALPIEITVGENSSPSGITVSVR